MSNDTNNWKVLVVDDEVLISETIRDYLNAAGIHNIRLAHDFETAISFIRLWQPDLVLLDIRLESHEEGITIGELLQNELGILLYYSPIRPEQYPKDHSDKTGCLFDKTDQ
jgi:two-component system response regulator LytT